MDKVEYVDFKSPEVKKIKLIKIGKFSFSTIEMRHLFISLVMITLTFMALDLSRVQNLGVLNFILIYFFTIGLGFLLHEFGHKLVAQHFGYVSEFRADFLMLFVAFLMAYFANFVFLAPGAVMILGRLSRRENGIVSLAGPLVNLGLAAIFALIGFIFNPTGIILYIVQLGIYINAFLGLFNMLPIWVLDGKKILAWNYKIYFLTLSCLLFFLIGSFIGWFGF